MPQILRGYCTGCSNFQCGGLCGDGGEKFSFRKGMNKSARCKLPRCCKGLRGPETFPPITTYNKDYTDVHHVPLHGVPLLIKSELLELQKKIRSMRYQQQECIPKVKRRNNCANDQYKTQCQATYVDHNNCLGCNGCGGIGNNCQCGQTSRNPLCEKGPSLSADLFNFNYMKPCCPPKRYPPQPRFHKDNLVKPGTDTIYCPGCPPPKPICPSKFGSKNTNSCTLCGDDRNSSCYDDLRKEIITPPRMYPPIPGLPKYVEDPTNPVIPRRASVLMYQNQTGGPDCIAPSTRFPIRFEFTKTDDPGPCIQPRDDYALSFYEHTFPAPDEDEETDKVTNNSIFPGSRKPNQNKRDSKDSNQNRRDSREYDKINRNAKDPYKPEIDSQMQKPGQNSRNNSIVSGTSDRNNSIDSGSSDRNNSIDSGSSYRSKRNSTDSNRKDSQELNENKQYGQSQLVNQYRKASLGSKSQDSTDLNQNYTERQNSLKSDSKRGSDASNSSRRESIDQNYAARQNSLKSESKRGSDASNSSRKDSIDKDSSKKKTEPEDPNDIVPESVNIPPPGIPSYCAELCGPPKDPRPVFNHFSTYDVDYYWDKSPKYKRYGGEITDPIPVKPLCYPGTFDVSKCFEKYRSEEEERYGKDWNLT